MKKIALFVMVLLVSLGALFAAGTKDDPSGAAPAQAVLRWAFWGNETRIQLSQKAADEYMKTHPNIKINIEPAGGTGDMFNRVDTQLAGGNGPDIIQMGGNFPDYVLRDVILELESLGSSGRGLINTSAIDQSALEAASLNGHLYGISHGVTFPVLGVNKTILEKAGVPLPKTTQTFEEFKAYLMQIKTKLPAGVYPMSDFGWQGSGAGQFNYWLRCNGISLYDRKTNTTQLTAAAAQRYLELWKDYRDNGLIPPGEIAAAYPHTGPDQTSDFVLGKAAITLFTSNMLSSYMGVMQDQIILIEPAGAASSIKPLWPQLSQVATINRASKNIDEAAKFIDFIVNSPVAASILGSNRGAPASTTYRTGMPSNPVDDLVNGYIAVAAPHSSPEGDHIPNDMERNSTGYLIYQGVYFGDLTTAQAGQELYDLHIRMINKQ
jgi:multiple sugar transport system substrate-binding protein